MGNRRAHARVPAMSTTPPGRCCSRPSAARPPQPFNVGTGTETRIRDLAETISALTGFEGETVWDASRPDGQPRRYLDVTRAREVLGFEAEIDLTEGLRRAIESFGSARAGAAA